MGRCIEHVCWDNGSDLLGRGGRVYLDGDLGCEGCQYGVHYYRGRRYPCQSSWRFFNLPGSGKCTVDFVVGGGGPLVSFLPGANA